MFAALSSCCSADCATALQVDLPPWTARSVVVLLGWVGFPLEGCRDKCLCVFLSLSLPVNSQNSSPQIPCMHLFVCCARSPNSHQKRTFIVPFAFSLVCLDRLCLFIIVMGVRSSSAHDRGGLWVLVLLCSSFVCLFCGGAGAASVPSGGCLATFRFIPFASLTDC